MKKNLSFVLLMFLSASLFSQGIKFEDNHNLNDALAKAKAENKLVFIDAYASWCGPCKMMAAKIFPIEEVGKYYNSNFVNLKLDMETTENLEIAKKYAVKAYPTYLFLNTDGEVIHRAIGGMPAEDFIKVAKTAGDTENNAMALTKKIKTGDRSAETLKKYIELNPYDKGNEVLINEYFTSLKDEEKTSKDAWEMFSQFVKDTKSESFQYFLKNRKAYEAKIGIIEVKNKIQNIIMTAYYTDRENYESLKSIDPVIFQESKTLIAINNANNEFREEESKENWDNFMGVITPYLNSNNDNSELLNNIAWLVYENYKTYNDKKSLANALNWAKKATVLAPEKDHILDTYAHILYESGKKKSAVTMETKALNIATKNKDTQSIESYKDTLKKFKK